MNRLLNRLLILVVMICFWIICWRFYSPSSASTYIDSDWVEATSRSAPHAIKDINLPAESKDDETINLPAESKDDEAIDLPAESEDGSKWDDFAIALKTGSEVALERVPIQLLTFLADVRNKIIIGDAPNIKVGGMEVIDVYTNLYDKSSLKKRDEAVKVNTSSVGWKTDAHKNLPGFRILREKFPDAKWYIMLDDDTYLLKNNLAHFLKDFDHDEEHYFGLSSRFKGCDGIKQFENGPAFAQGGSGIVLSSGAMNSLIPNIDKCIHEYKTCFAGDVRTALCLRDSGVLLTKTFSFHKDPPQMVGKTPACEKSLTFHHLLVNQIQKLWEIETKWLSSGKKLISFADIYNQWVPKADTDELLSNVDLPGSDINHFYSEDAESCQTSCRSEPRCVSFSYVKDVCWLKDAIPLAKDRSDATSGIIRERFKCSEDVAEVTDKK